MPDFTKEQKLAITEDGKNIIVSAGAGSGKTEVLSERVIHKLKKGIKVNELLILTFTNAAAAEMKDRIRKKINDYDELKDNLDYLESAYITTFDSFTLSLVKKYHYVLNVSPKLNIIDDSIIGVLKKDILTQVFDEFYEDGGSLFQKFIKDFAVKNDKSLKDYILGIIKSLELKSDIDYYLDNYLVHYFNEKRIDEYIREYVNLMHYEIDNIESNLMALEDSEYPEFYDACLKALDKLIKAKTYDEIKMSIPKILPRRPNGSDDIKEFKTNIDESLKSLKDYTYFDNTLEIKESLNIMKDYVEVIIKIIKRYLVILREYKNETDLYEFQDIALMAIKLLRDNNDIRSETKNFYKEILVDEYQDTSDLQEEFISLIENNNVYMVGDIKQSIYRFRNANPSIFKDKYERFSKNNGGIKIDLLKNFRSRSEVLDGINEIFNLVMDDTLGGADYINSHQMNFGNQVYLENKAEQNYKLEILNYDKEEVDASLEEIESFIIAKNIKEKIENKYQVYDKSLKSLRDARYEDFCIIMDRESSFPIYKKIFEYLGIPLTIYANNKLTNAIDIIMLNNLLGFILKVNNKTKDTEFKYYFMSIARSFLFAYSDNEIFKIIKENIYEETDIYKISLEISELIDTLDNYEIIDLIINKFNFYEKIIEIGNVEEGFIRVNNLLDIAKNLSEMGYTINMFKEYLSKMLDGKNEIKYSVNGASSNSVKIMNIHKSKGLEFPICYFSGYYKDFNQKDINDRFTYDNKYGIITPYFKDGIAFTILRSLYKEKNILDDISEKIRLFYVALTRAKEKMIIVSPMSVDAGKTKGVVDLSIRRKYKSFADILNSIIKNLERYTKIIDLETIGITKDYLYESKERVKLENNSEEIIEYHMLNINNESIETKHASKTLNELVSKEESDILNTGTMLHKYFEQTDFLNIEECNPYKDKITRFVKKLNINGYTQVYKEHEFMYEDADVLYHGIIDLVLLEKDVIKIVDYKLKNIDDPKYIDQLTVYYNYLKTIFDKEIKLYLYSIFNDELKEINID